MSRRRLIRTSRALARALALSCSVLTGTGIGAGCGDDGGPADVDVDAAVAQLDAPIAEPDGAPVLDAAPTADAAPTPDAHCEEATCGQCGPTSMPSDVFGNDPIVDLRERGSLAAYLGFTQPPGMNGLGNAYALIFPKSGIVLDQPYDVALDVELPQFLALYGGGLLSLDTYDDAYGAQSGTVVFASIGDCVTGTLSNATFVALSDITPTTAAAGGCSFEVETVDFTFGDFGDCTIPPPPPPPPPPL